MTQKMQALVKAQAAPGLWLQAIDIPTFGAHDVLIKIKKTAICGTDLHIYKWDDWAQKTIPIGMQVGHEFVGEIVAMGSGVEGFQIGERVSGEGHITCGHCRNCRAGKRHFCRHTLGLGVNRPGCFAQYLSFPASNVVKVPDSIPDQVAAALDPLGNAVHTALSFDLIGEDVLITGAGPIGLMAAAICRYAGARFVVITDINDYRLNMARNLGVDAALNVSDCKTHDALVAKIQSTMTALHMIEGFDVGLEISGFNNAIDAMLATMNHGGKMAFLGLSAKPISLNWDDVIFKGLLMKGIYGREMFETWYKSIALLQGGLNVSSIITHVLPATQFEEAFKLIQSGHCGKVVLDWG